jgi:hypothetical protein
MSSSGDPVVLAAYLSAANSLLREKALKRMEIIIFIGE